MSSNRRQQQRDQQRRQRRDRRRQSRQNAASYEPAHHIEFTGPMGFMQRHTREFFLGGILLMVLSLGGIFFSSRLGSRTVTPNTTPTAEPTTASETATPDATTDQIVRSYDAAPAMTIDPTKSYQAVIHLETGDVRIELDAADAPEYVNNFVFLAEHQFYDGLTFHRVIPGFVAQTGDPTGAGFGSPGYTLDPEKNSLQFERGSLSMAEDVNGNVNGSQFFITLGPTPYLNSDFTVFGRVTEGMDLLDGLTPRDPTNATGPGDTIVSVEIVEGA